MVRELLILFTCSNIKFIALDHNIPPFIGTAQYDENANQVMILSTGYSRESATQPDVMHCNCSSTLIRSKTGTWIVVDTMTPWHRTQMLDGKSTSRVPALEIIILKSPDISCIFLFTIYSAISQGPHPGGHRLSGLHARPFRSHRQQQSVRACRPAHCRHRRQQRRCVHGSRFRGDLVAARRWHRGDCDARTHARLRLGGGAVCGRQRHRDDHHCGWGE